MSRKEEISFADARGMFKAAAKTIQSDIDNNAFGFNEVFWLSNEPVTTEELVENLFERLRALGMCFSIDPDDVDLGAITAAGMWRGGRNW